MLETKRILTVELILSFLLTFFSISLTLTKFRELSNLIPLWFTRAWGEAQFADRKFISLIPLLAVLMTALNVPLIIFLWRQRETTLAKFLSILTLGLNSLLYVALFRIVDLSSAKSNLPWFLEPKIITPLFFSAVLSFLLTPLTIKLASRFGLIDNPKTHKHPAMLLTRAVPRAGTTPVIAAIIVASLFFIPLNRALVGIFLAALISLGVGLLDDRLDLNPYIRFASQVVSAVIIVSFGVQINYINNPSGGVLPITNPNFKINFLNPIYPLAPLAILATLFWIIWTMNMLSWSNGVDGQFPGIVSIAAIVVGLLSIRDLTQERTTLFAFITAGATLGTTPYTWHKSHLLYGFGAASLGLILASLSILSGTKVATALLVLMVPTLDAFWAIVRRLRTGQSPFWGDRAHLHHKFLDLGFSQSQIASLYWIVSAVLGVVAVSSSGSVKMLAILTAAGVFSFLLIFINTQTENEN